MSATMKVTPVRPLPKASFRWRFPDRALHVVDIENLAGAPIPSLALVTEVQLSYLSRLGPGADDQVVLAASHLGLLNAGLGWPHARYRVRSGKHGADLALIDVLEHENVAARFSHVVIGSGDGLFGAAAARLADRGVYVTVVSRRGSLAQALARVARDVIYLDAPLTVAA
jgi:NYN domain